MPQAEVDDKAVSVRGSAALRRSIIGTRSKRDGALDAPVACSGKAVEASSACSCFPPYCRPRRSCSTATSRPDLLPVAAVLLTALPSLATVNTRTGWRLAEV